MSKNTPALLAAGLFALYLEACTLFSEDMSLFGRVLKGQVQRAIAVKGGRINFFYVLENFAQSKPDQVALIFPDQVKPLPSKDVSSLTSEQIAECFVVEKYTYKQIYETTLKYARVLHEQYGVDSSSTVSLDCINKPQFLFAWFAIWSLGATPALINYNLTSKGLVHCINAANSSVLMVDSDPEVTKCVDPVRNDLSNVKVLVMDESFERSVASSELYRAPDEDRHPEHQLWDTAVYIYTSGTTGLPKPAVVSWRKIRFGSVAFGSMIKVSPNDTVYTAMPLYHSTAGILGAMTTLNAGAKLAIGRKFSTSTFWSQVRLSGASMVQYVGEAGRFLVNSPRNPDERLHNVKLAYGNGMRADIWAEFKDRFNIPTIGEFFASTEGPLALYNHQSGAFGVGSVGRYGSIAGWLLLKKAHTLVKVDVDAESDDGTPVIWRDPKTGFCVRPQVGEPGEILAIVPNASKVHETFQGYKNNPKANKEKIIFDVFKKGDAYVRSGDLMKMDEEGLIYFVDRMGDTFRWKSENVATGEVEHVVASYGKTGNGEGPIYQAVVVGVKVPQHEGRAGLAVISLNGGSTTPDERLIKGLGPYLLSELPRYAVPVFIKFVPEIIKTGNNKVQKHVYRGQKFGKERDSSDTETIYFLKGDTYVPLTDSDWDQFSNGKARL